MEDREGVKTAEGDGTDSFEYSMGAGGKTSHSLEDVSIFDPKMSFTVFKL